LLTVSRRLLIIAISCLALTPRAQAQNLFFQPPTYAGSPPTVTADFNGDGKPDLASADGTVQLGNGDGTFKTGTPWTTGQSVTSATPIAAADFNGDGKPDLVFSSGTSLFVLLGNGDGTFQTAISTNIGTSLSPFVVADVNGDGKADVLGIGASGLFVFFGKGNGTFAPGISYGLVSNQGVPVIAVADFNGDGHLDVALAAFGGSSAGLVSVYIGNGNGTFQPAITSTGVISPIGLATGDFNGDGKLDLALSDSSTGETFILLGNGNGTLQSFGAPLPAYGPLATADVNGDHILDLVVGSPDFVEIFLGKGDGTFNLKDTYFDGAFFVQNQADVVVADFNGDGKPDVATAGLVLLGNGDGSFQGDSGVPIPASQSGFSGGASGDFNHDGVADVALLSSNNASNLYILLNNGTGNFSLAHTYVLPMPGSSIATADLNGDGKLDLVVVASGTVSGVPQWSLLVLLGNGDGSFGPPISFPQGTSAGDQAGAVAVADFNGDHKPDVAVLSSSGLEVFLGKGDGTFGAPVSYFAGAGAVSFVVADFNNDGIPDLAAAGSAGLALLLGKGDGTFQGATFTTLPIFGLLGAADLNRDGNVDLVADTGAPAGSSSGTDGILVLLGSGNGTFTALPQTSILSIGTPVSLVDLNSDGKLDLVETLTTHSPSLTSVQVALGNGDGTFANPISVLQQGGVQCGCAVFVADFNHHNRPDLAVAYPEGLTTVLNTSGPPAPDFLLSTTGPSPSPVKPGSAATFTVTLTSVGGFTGSVALACTGLPSGANCSFAPSSVSSPGSSTLTITTASSTPVGTYPVTVKGSSSSITNTVVVTLAVATSAGATTANLAPNSLAFAQQAISASSSPQTVQLTNTGGAALAISSVSISGTNAGDFGQTNSCTSASPLAAGANCQISVTFKPTGMSSRTASLSVSSNATGSPQIVSLSGSGPDFSVSSGSTTTATVMPGQTATYNLSVAPLAGFNQTVTLTCSGAPALTTCTISPSSVQLNGTATVIPTVTITTTAPMSGLGLPLPRGNRFIGQRPQLLLVGIATMLLIAMLRTRKRNSRPYWATPLAFTALLLLAATLSSCGGGSSSGSTRPPSSAGTAAGTYTITVTGSAGTGSAATHAISFTFVVQ
jgi:hypothetical protein